MILTLMYVLTMISGLNASLLGVLWPVMYMEFDVSLSAVGVMSWISSGVGMLADLAASRVIRRFGASRVTVVCACISAAAMFGYTVSGEYWMLCALCVPGSMAGGIIGVAMNNYVALHYPSRHMSWVHCMWGVGSIIGPNIVAYGLAQGYTWHMAYRCVFAAWAVWAVAIICARRLWKPDTPDGQRAKAPALPFRQLLRIRGAKEALLTFFCYNSLEQGMMMWMSSYMVLHSGISEELAANYASLFFVGITAGRLFSGALTLRFSDDRIIRFGHALIALGIVLMILPLGMGVTLAGMLLIGLGCAPLCPCMLHSTPMHFGAEHSQALVGIQVAVATLGNCVLPSLFGLVASGISIALLPAYLVLCLAVMFIAHRRLVRVTAGAHAVA